MQVNIDGFGLFGAREYSYLLILDCLPDVFVVGIHAEYLVCSGLFVSVELFANFNKSSQVFAIIPQCCYVKLICAETSEMAEQFIDLAQCASDQSTDPSNIECDCNELLHVKPNRRLVHS